MTDVTVEETRISLSERGLRGTSGSDVPRVVVPCTVTVVGATWKLTLDTDYVIVEGGVDQVFGFIAPSDSAANTAYELVGLNDGDPRQARLADGVTAPAAGAIKSGGYVLLKPKASGFFEMVYPYVSSQGSTKQPLVMCEVSGTANALTLTPLTGYAAEGSGADQLFGGTADFDSTGAITVVVAGLNTGDPRNLYLPGGASAAIPAGTLQAGEYVEVRYIAATGHFELTFPSSAGAAPQPLVDCTITGTNSLVFTPKAGYAVSGGGVSQRFYGKAAADNTTGINADVVGATNGDARNVYLPGGASTAVPAGLIQAGEMVEIKYVEATGYFELVHPTVQAEDTSGGLTTYQQIQARRTGDNAAKAATLARRALLA